MTYAVLIPCSLGYCLFVRWPYQRLRTTTDIVHPADVRDMVGALGDPLTVVLVGRRHADAISDAVLHHAELVIVPDAWLRRVPRRALSSRAELAVRLAAAHRAATIEHRFRRGAQMSLPF
jgi:hypothetical protein